jgi:hypothetical protein
VAVIEKEDFFRLATEHLRHVLECFFVGLDLAVR